MDMKNLVKEFMEVHKQVPFEDQEQCLRNAIDYMKNKIAAKKKSEAKKKKLQEENPDNAFLLFHKWSKDRIRIQHPGVEDISKIVYEEFKNLPAIVKQLWEERAARNHEKYY